jgi:hypothetical protein
MAKTEVATKGSNALPAHLQGGKTTRIGNIDQSDLIIPRVKLLQAISPEVTDFDNAKAGEFWHTIAGQSMGKELLGVPIILRKSYVLWSPRNDDRGVLARANDGLNWDNAGMEFEVKPKGSPHPVKYKLGKTVHESVDGAVPLSEFGSSIPGDANSPPAAALTYQFLWYFPDFPDLSPAIIINTRSSVKPGKALLSKIDLRPVDHFAQVYKIGIVQERGDEGPYNNYTYTADGYADEETYEITKGLYERFDQLDWRANDETEDPDKHEGGGRAAGPADSSKF